MEDETLCSVCSVNDLINERERVEGICDECRAEDMADEQDFDESIYIDMIDVENL